PFCSASRRSTSLDRARGRFRSERSTAFDADPLPARVPPAAPGADPSGEGARELLDVLAHDAIVARVAPQARERLGPLLLLEVRGLVEALDPSIDLVGGTGLRELLVERQRLGERPEVFEGSREPELGRGFGVEIILVVHTVLECLARQDEEAWRFSGQQRLGCGPGACGALLVDRKQVARAKKENSSRGRVRLERFGERGLDAARAKPGLELILLARALEDERSSEHVART